MEAPTLEVKALKTQLDKAKKDLARLRSHLLLKEKESGETLEDLKQQLEAFKARENQLVEMEQTNLRLKQEFCEKEKEYQRTSTELANLQSVLEQFQEDQENEITLRTLHLTNEINRLKQDLHSKSEQNLQLTKDHEQCYVNQNKIKELEATLEQVVQENSKYKSEGSHCFYESVFVSI